MHSWDDRYAQFAFRDTARSVHHTPREDIPLDRGTGQVGTVQNKLKAIRMTPPGFASLFSESHNFLVWSDETHIGFADRHFASIYPRASVLSVELDNYLPERSPAFSSLSVTITEQIKRENTANADYGVFDSFLSDIGTFLHLPVRKNKDSVGL